jgi:cobalt-zinc-cadmium efflux system outer membrane protein
MALVGVFPSVSTPPPPRPVDLPELWNLALANHPLLREAEANVEAARGQWIQAGKYPNPRFVYRQSVLGTTQDPAGDLTLEATQEIITCGKRRLDQAIGARKIDLAALALLARRFAVLTRLRRAYHEYVNWVFTLQVSNDAVAALEEGVRTTRRLVEEAKLRPRTDLARLMSVLEETRLTRDSARISLEAAWRQVAAEVGIPTLPLPAAALERPMPRWETDAVLNRVLAVHTDLKQAFLETERARIEVERARAEAVPNVTIGAGYSANYPERQHGPVVGIETSLPLWDRKQGRIHEAQARLAQARAAEQSAAVRLTQQTSEALGRYFSASQRVERLTNVILPQQVESLQLIRRGYQAGAAATSFADVLLAEQMLNETRYRLAEARQTLGAAVADLQGLMQLDMGEDLNVDMAGRPNNK